jgi:DNA repair protein RadD
MLGRGIRIHPSKNKCTVTDLCGNVDRLGKIENWIIRDENGNKKYRLFNGNTPLTGTDLKTGEDLEKGSSSKDRSLIHFGKYKGQKITEVPASYLSWIIENFSPGDFRNQAANEIARRAVSNV